MQALRAPSTNFERGVLDSKDSKEVIVLVWEDFGEIDVNGTRTKLAVNERNRFIAFVEDNDGCVLHIVEVFLSLHDLARKHLDWLGRIVLISDNENILDAYEKLLETRGQKVTQGRA